MSVFPETIVAQEEEICVIRICGPMGSGKSSIVLSAAFYFCTFLANPLLITNMKILKIPSELKDKLEVYQSGDIRKILEKMAEGRECVVAIDELDASISSSKSASTSNVLLISVSKDARKFRCRAMIYSSIPRKAVDSKLRASDTYVHRPMHKLNTRGEPLLHCWSDPESFENDFDRGEDLYQFAFTMSYPYSLSFIRTAFSTLQRIPVSLDAKISQTEIPQYVLKFLIWCDDTRVNLPGLSEKHVQMFLGRWNDEAGFLIPLTPKGLQIIFTELIRLGVLNEPTEPQSSVIGVVDLVPSKPRGVSLTCQKCQNVWVSRTPNPKKCPLCQSQKWRKLASE